MTSASSQSCAKRTTKVKLIAKKRLHKQPSSSSEHSDWCGDYRAKPSDSVRVASSEPEKDRTAKVNVRVGEPEKDRKNIILRVDIGQRDASQFTVHLVGAKRRRVILNVQAVDWDFKLYTFSEFQKYYKFGAEERWRPARSATKSANDLVDRCGKKSAMKKILNTILKPFVHETSSAEQWHNLLFEFFYVPLRWRCEFLQQQRVPEEDWHSHRITSSEDINASWDYVKKWVWHHKLNQRQRENGKSRSIIHLIINRFSKCAHACRLIIIHGVSNEEILLFALHAMIYVRKTCPAGISVARFATGVAKDRVKIQLRPRPGHRLQRSRVTQEP